MRKILFALVAIIALVNVSCDKNDDREGINGNVVGKWTLQSMIVNGESSPVGNSYLNIKNDGMFEEFDEGFYALGEWKQVSGKLEINYDNDLTYQTYPNQGYIASIPTAYTIKKLTDNEMVLTATILGYEGTLTYKK